MEETWTEEMKRYEELGCLHEIFDCQAKLTPDSIAVVDNLGRELTYQELNRAADTLADHLILCGVVRNSSVGIYMERCMEYVVAYVAILKAGGAYIPLDVSYPDGLLNDIFSDAKPVCVVTNKTMALRLQGKKQRTIILDDDWQDMLKQANQKAIENGKKIERGKVELDDLAYVVYSSGTTGKPKGIMCPHRGAVFSYAWRHLVTPFQENDRVACNVFFVWEMLRPLLKGFPLYVIPDTTIYDPLLLSKFIKEHSITRMLFTPSLLETVLDAPDVSMGDFASMRLIWFCGEVVTTSLLDRCSAKLPWVKFFNLYSISESHDVSYCDLNKFLQEEGEERNSAKRRKFAPVGKVYPEVNVVILDENGKPQPVGMPGEIYVGGPTLAHGYLNRDELNKVRFVSIPEGVVTSFGDQLYRTGDWGLIRSDRNLEICGRCDTMVKIRGYSIEIQAVENALVELESVNACVVLAVGEEGQDKQLVAYVVPEEGATKKTIRDALKSKLPFYMIPTYFVFLGSIPVLPASGKLDKKALPSVFSRRASEVQLFTSSRSLGGGEDRSAPISESEEFLESAWKEILQMEFIDVQESFFDLGGHSLLAARLLSKIREHYSCDITMQVLFSNPTIVGLAKWLDNGQNGSKEQESSSELDLNAEVVIHGIGQVNMDIQLRAFWRSMRFGNRLWRARVLLTGATGFLGAYILRELLMTTKAQIYCLARRHPETSARDRLLQNLDFYEVFKHNNKDNPELLKLFDKRVHPMTGDVALVEMGLNEEDYAYLTYEIDYVIHAAAYVNLVYPYDVLKGTNVTGTQHVLLFARTGKIKPVHYVSTNAVYPDGKTSCKEAPVGKEDSLALSNGYSQSKWVSEAILQKAIQQGLPVSIYRIGNISGDSNSGGWNPADFILLVLRASLMTSSFPDVEWQIEMTPVDFVSKCIVRLSQELRSSVHKIFHVVQPERITGRWLCKWLTEQFGYKLEMVSMDEWCNRLDASTKYETPRGHPDVKRMLESITRTKDPALFGYNTTFDQSNLTTALSNLGTTYPSMDDKLLRGYVSHLVRRNVLPSPPPPKLNSNSTLEGRVAVVTGGSSGIGRSIAFQLAQAGAKVCFSGRNLERLKEAESHIKQVQKDVTFMQCNVDNRKQMKDLIKHAETNLGPVDILVNNAGQMYYTHMSNVMMDDWDKMIDTNCKGVTNGVGAVLPGMLEREKGHIVNISSDAGLRGFPGLAVYSGTKFFVEGFSQALRHEVLPKGIKVTCIQPGDVKTNLLSVTNDQEARNQYDGSTQVRILDPDDIGRAVAYVVSQPHHVAINQLLIEPREAPI